MAVKVIIPTPLRPFAAKRDSAEFRATTRVHIERAPDVRHALLQFRRRDVAVDARQRGVGHEIMPVRRRLKNAFHQVIENAVIFFFRRHGSHVDAMAFDGVSDGPLEPSGRELAFDEIILRAGVNGFDRKSFIVARS